MRKEIAVVTLIILSLAIPLITYLFFTLKAYQLSTYLLNLLSGIISWYLLFRYLFLEREERKHKDVKRS